MKLLIMGPPGAGKGTQATRLAQALRVPHVSTGDIFRDNVDRQTHLGRAAQAFMDRGEYVPDELTNALVEDRLDRTDARAGFILDGYPRTPAQVTELTSALNARDETLDAVLCLDVPRRELVQRLTARGADSGRNDDDPQVVNRRLDLYDEQTSRLTDIYDRQGLLHVIDGTGTVDQVTARLQAVLDATRVEVGQDEVEAAG